jgi:hypothetical protein
MYDFPMSMRARARTIHRSPFAALISLRSLKTWERLATIMAGFLRRTIGRISDLIHSDPGEAPVTAAVDMTKGNGAHDPAATIQEAEWLSGDRHRQKLLDLYLFAVDACLRGKADQWWLRTFGADVFRRQTVPQIKDFCLHHVLYETGDIPAFLKIYDVLEKEGHLRGDDAGLFLLKLTRYVDGVLRGAGQAVVRQEERPAAAAGLARYFNRALGHSGRMQERRPAVVSVIISGGPELRNFFEFCLPSLAAAKGGLETLARARAVSLLVFGRERDLPTIVQRIEAAKLDCTIVCQPIPEDIAVLAEGVDGPQSEWLGGMLQCLHLMEAKRLDADFHSINPNAVYAESFFKGLLDLEAGREQAVLLASLYIDPDPTRRELARFRNDGTLAISAIDLTSVGLRGMARVSDMTVFHDHGHLGRSTSHLQAMWEEKDRVLICSTHYEIAFLSHAVLRRLPSKFFMKPSMEVDRILGAGTSPHFVKESDQIAMLNLGGAKNTSDGRRMNVTEFGEVLAQCTRLRQGEYFKQPIRLAISRTDFGRRLRRDDPSVDGERRAIFRVLDESRASPTLTADRVLSALHTLHHYELSEYGRENLPGVIDEGRRLLRIIQLNGAEMDDAQIKELIRVSMNFDDVESAIAFAKRGQGATAFVHEFLVEMMRLKTANTVRAHELHGKFPRRSFAVVGSVVWGRYVAKFMNYCVPSLLADGNIPTLAKKKRVVHSIVTTEADREIIVAHPAFARLSEVAEVVFTCFPAKFLEEREQAGYSFYQFYGLLDHQNVFLASALGADLYLLPVDCVYSRESLKHLSEYLEKDADCCSIAGIEADEAQLLSWLDARRESADVLSLSSGDLLQAACERLDAYFRSLMVSADNTAFCMHPRELVWPVADGLAIHSIFMHPLAVSARMLSRPFHPYHENVDFALLPRLLQGDGKLKVIEDAREAAIAHFGAPLGRAEYLEGGFSVRSFVEAHRYDYAAQRRFFSTRQFFPCRDLPYAPSVDYADELALIQAALVRYRFRADAE